MALPGVSYSSLELVQALSIPLRLPNVSEMRFVISVQTGRQVEWKIEDV